MVKSPDREGDDHGAAAAGDAGPGRQAELEHRYQTTREATTRTRYQMVVLLRAEGHPVLQVARITRRSPDTVHHVLKRYLAGGPDAVPHRPNPGQPPHFFLEYDRGTEPLDRLTAYHQLVDATQIPTPVLFWLLSSGREATVRQALAGHNHGATVPFLVATASPALGHGPPEQAWLPLGQTWPRRRLIDLADLHPDWKPNTVGPTAR